MRRSTFSRHARSLLRPLARVACALSLLATPSVQGDELPPATHWIPPNVIVSLEVSDAAALLDPLLDDELAAAVSALPVYQQATSTPGFQQFRAVVGTVESQIGTDWRSGLRKLLGGGITFAARTDGATLLIVDALDARTLDRLHQAVLAIAMSATANAGEGKAGPAGEIGGLKCWTFGKDEIHAILGRRLIMANRRDILVEALDLRLQAKADSLARLPSYRNAKKAVGSDVAATAFIHLAGSDRNESLREALAAADEPLTSLLFAGVIESLKQSSWAAFGLSVKGAALALSAHLDGASGTTGPASFSTPRDAGKGALPNLSVPRRIAALSLYRDLHGFYAAKDELFPERTSGLIFFENMMAIFFSGLDLTEEVLAELGPEMRVVVAEQEYDAAIGTPAIQYPGFAMVFRLRSPQAFGEIVEEAWQKALGLINFTRGQQALPGLVIDREMHGDTKFTIAYFRPPREGDRTRLEPRYNLRPALAQVGEHLILSSTEGLARDLIDAVRREKKGRVLPGKTHSSLELDAPQLLSILRANRDVLIRQNMVNDGNSRSEAETQIGLFLLAADALQRVEISLASPAGRMRARLAVRFRLPAIDSASAERAEPTQVASEEPAHHDR